MAKTIKREQDAKETDVTQVFSDAAVAPDDMNPVLEAISQEEVPVADAWAVLRVAIIDDAMHPPLLGRMRVAEEVATVTQLLVTDAEIVAELKGLGCDDGASPDERLLALTISDEPLVAIARLGAVSADLQRMIEEHRSFRRLSGALQSEVAELLICDPYATAVPDMSQYDLVLLDYYLDGSENGGGRAVTIAAAIRSQKDRLEDQQIVLMSSLESVRDLRGEFREKSELAGSAFAFVGKRDLNEPWKIKAHLGMLERARPYAPAFTQYRTKLDESLVQARTDLLALVDDLDIGDYAFLQGRALMKDGHPLGDYIFWLLSSQLMALAFEREEMRARQKALDALEFVGEPFAATEPSAVVANMLHSALVSRDVGPLGPHPRARADGKYSQFPLVQLGDVFLDKDRTKAVVVMSADCDLAFSPTSEREPDAETPVMLVPGTPVKLKEAEDEAKPRTEGILHRDEVYRIVWNFGKYRSVSLGELEKWLRDGGFDVSNRDRLRPLFGLKLQQEFGAHLLRVGPPLLPPMTTPAAGQIFICRPEREGGHKFDHKELMITRFKGITMLRITPNVAGMLKLACEDLRDRLEDQLAVVNGNQKASLGKKIQSVTDKISDDTFWIELLRGVELNKGGAKSLGPLGFVLGTEWQDPNKPLVMLQIDEELATPSGTENSTAVPVPHGAEPEIAAVSGAG